MSRDTGVLLHVLAHVEAVEADAEDVRELLGDLGLADAGRTGEQERADRLLRPAEAGARDANRGRQRLDRLVLAEDRELQVLVQALEAALVRHRHAARRDPRDLGDDALDVRCAHRLLLLVRRQDLDRRRGLVDDVDRLVRQAAIVDVLRRQLGGSAQGGVGVHDAVVRFVVRLEPFEDPVGLLDRGLVDLDLLEAARQGVIALEIGAVLVVGGRADAANLAGAQHRLEDVRRIHRAAAGGAGTDDGVDLVDEQHRALFLLERVDHRLEPLLELATVFRAGQQRPHVERVNGAVGEHVGHGTAVDLEREALGDRGLADAGVAHVERVVLAAAAEHVDGALDLVLAADERIDVALGGALVEVDGVRVERLARLAARLVAALPVLAVLLTVRLGLVAAVGDLRDAVRDVAQHVDPLDVLLLEQEHGVRIRLAEHRDQHVAPADLLLAGGLDVHRRAMEHAAEADRLDRLGLLILRQLLQFLLEVLIDLLFQALDVAAAVANHLGHFVVMQQGVEYMLERQVLVVTPHRFA
jgi:hypothetical protein